MEATSSPPRRDLVVIGASAGGVQTLKRIVADLPPELPAAICIVLHLAPESPSALAGILRRAGKLPSTPATDGQALQAGTIVVGIPDRHLMVEDGRVRLTIGPRENNHRPSVDALFRSAAMERGSGVVGVILSGNRDDGTAGLAVIKAQGGGAIVQDPADAMYSGMPTSALEHVAVDAVVPCADIAQAIAAMVNGQDLPGGSDPEASAPDRKNPEGQILTCPGCGGVLSERQEAGVNQWECRVGHRYSPETFVDANAEDVEAALWTGIRALLDRSRLLHRMADRAESRGQTRSARSFRRGAATADQQALLVRRALNQAAEAALRKIVDGATDPAESEGHAA